jgi:hypothetical protein
MARHAIDPFGKWQACFFFNAVSSARRTESVPAYVRQFRLFPETLQAA